MSEKKIVVPEGMLEAAVCAFMLLWDKWNGAYINLSTAKSVEAECRKDYAQALQAALRWMDGELEKMPREGTDHFSQGYRQAIIEIRRMFCAPEPDVPEADRLFLDILTNGRVNPTYSDLRDITLQAYQCGRNRIGTQ